MSSIGAKIVTKDLAFHYDMGNPRSFVGAPTTNYMNVWHPRKDASYAIYVATGTGLWQNNHPDALTVYSHMTDGSITGFVNSGVTDYANTDHCVWTYDVEIGEPVITYRNYDGGAWKAFNSSHGINLAALGMSTGDYYTYSYDLWTTHLNYRPNPGFYSRNFSAVAGFHDGQGGLQESNLPLVVGKWHRRWCTFQVSANHDLNGGLVNFYWYGQQYQTNEVMKIRRPQLELFTNVASSWTLTPRSATEAIIDVAGGNIITIDSLTYDDDRTFRFNGAGTTDGVTAGDNLIVDENKTNTINYPQGCTYNFWLNVDTDADNRLSVLFGAGTIRHIELYSTGKYFRTEAALENNYSFGSGAFPDNVRGVWANFSIVFANAEATRPVRWYQNGKLFHTGSMDGGANPGTEYFSFSRIGRSTGSVSYLYAKSFKGKISPFSIYSNPLTEQEIRQNFNAIRGRYGI